METRAYFKVPFASKDAAKGWGARWDPEIQCWYAPDNATAVKLAEHFPTLANPQPITELPGEDREFGGNRLFVDLVPASCWFTNVRYCVEPEDWERLIKGVRARAGKVCEICGGGRDPDQGVELEAHERWQFDEETGVQSLRRIVCLCTACHRTTHYGLSQLRGDEQLIRAHFMAVNECEEAELDRHVYQAFELWQERNQRVWTLDLSVIENAGIRLKRTIEASARPLVATEELGAQHLENQSSNAPDQGGMSVRPINSMAELDALLRGF